MKSSFKGSPKLDFKPMQKESVHHILSYSYTIYFLGIIVGILLDRFLPIRVIPNELQATLGPLFLLAGPLLILWAQRSSRRLKQNKSDLSKECFKVGPYCFTRKPTHIGLFFMVLGFALISNSVVLIGTTIISYIFSSIFIRRQENILSEKYGEEYLKYKKEVRSWL